MISVASTQAGKSYLGCNFGVNTLARLEASGYTLREARQFAFDLFQVNWYEGDEEEHILAMSLLGIDARGVDDFSEQERLQDGLEALLNHQAIDYATADNAAKMYWEHVPSVSVSAIVVRIIDEVYHIDPTSEIGYGLQCAYWSGHGLQYDPRTLYPYIAQDSPVLEAVRRGLAAAFCLYEAPVPDKYAMPLDVAITHDIVAELLWSDVHGEDAVDDAFRGWLIVLPGITESDIFPQICHAAIAGFWGTFGIQVDDEGCPQFPDDDA